jgi:hypothetical protein
MIGPQIKLRGALCAEIGGFFGIFVTVFLAAFGAVGAFAQTPNPCPKNSPFSSWC